MGAYGRMGSTYVKLDTTGIFQGSVLSYTLSSLHWVIHLPSKLQLQERVSNPSLPRDTFQTKSLPLSLWQANLPVYSFLPAPTSTQTFPNWMEMAIYIFQGKKSWHHHWLFSPLLSLKLLTLTLTYVWLFDLSFSIFMITTVIYAIIHL